LKTKEVSNQVEVIASSYMPVLFWSHGTGF